MNFIKLLKRARKAPIRIVDQQSSVPEVSRRVRAIVPTEALVIVRSVLEPEERKESVLLKYIELLALEIGADVDWVAVYDEALRNPKLCEEEKDFLAMATLEMQELDLRYLGLL